VEVLDRVFELGVSQQLLQNEKVAAGFQPMGRVAFALVTS
jgi:hypothetical protein